jgi:hypothetical protein
MREGKQAQANIAIRSAGRTWIGPPMLRILVDGVCVGVLKDPNGHLFPISAGPHTLQVRRDLVKSTILDLDLSVGQRAYFEYGVNHGSIWAASRFMRITGILALIPWLIISTAIGLPRSWSAGIFVGLIAVPAGLVAWRSYMAAGAYLYLRMVGTSNLERLRPD